MLFFAHFLKIKNTYPKNVSMKLKKKIKKNKKQKKNEIICNAETSTSIQFVVIEIYTVFPFDVIKKSTFE